MTLRVFSHEQLTDEVRCDHLIIGSGAGASVAGMQLAKAGLDVVMIEEGSHHPTESFDSNVGRQTAMLYRNGGITPFMGNPSIAFAEGRCVGGTTVINGGLIWRTPDWILEEWSRNHGLHSYSMEHLSRHFATIETNLHVQKTSVESVADNLDSLRLHQGARQLGWNSVVVPRAVRNCRNSNLCPTGCPSGAKQSMALSYLPSATNNGARLYSGCRAVRIEHQGGRVTGVVVQSGKSDSRTIHLRCDHLILGAGAIQSPHLLRRSGLVRGRTEFQFHLNLKFIVDFEEPVHAGNGTIFTTQVQEFQRDGMLLMAANIQPAYVALPFAGKHASEIATVLERYDHLALYTAMIRPRGRGRIFSGLGPQPLLRAQLTDTDVRLAKEACMNSVKVFFTAGARTVYLPLKGAPAVTSADQAAEILAKARRAQFEFVSVHAMSSLPMSNTQSPVNEAGQLNGYSNLFVMDASVLPTNIGESPQGTIMAFAHELAERYLEKDRSG